MLAGHVYVAQEDVSKAKSFILGLSSRLNLSGEPDPATLRVVAPASQAFGFSSRCDSIRLPQLIDKLRREEKFIFKRRDAETFNEGKYAESHFLPL